MNGFDLLLSYKQNNHFPGVTIGIVTNNKDQSQRK